MAQDKIYKTIRQYNKEPLTQEDMKKLQDIADDYAKVKNYVYQRYGGIWSLAKIYPGYTVQNEMTESGLRIQLGLPSVFFYLAVFEALGDIKSQWAKVKAAVLRNINQNERLLPEEKHYIRFALKVSGCFEGILCCKPVEIPSDMLERYKDVSAGVSDREKLHQYIRRQVRKNLKKLHTEKADCFAISERAYRYGESGGQAGIFLSTKENRRRIFVPLTDTNRYKQQLRVKLLPSGNDIELLIAVEKEIQHHEAYNHEIGLSLGIWQMCTTHEGHVYGERMGEMHLALVDFIAEGSKTYQREKQNNPGKKKYQNGKARLEAALHDYINAELNRLLATEKPRILYIPRFPKSSAAGVNGRINHSTAVWQRGYIRKRLAQKCRGNGIEIAEVIGKNISTQCSRCGAQGKYEKDLFRCGTCGYQEDKKTNAAANALQRGQGSGRLDMTYLHN